MITIKCQCGETYHADEGHAGRWIVCKNENCNRKLLIQAHQASHEASTSNEEAANRNGKQSQQTRTHWNFSFEKLPQEVQKRLIGMQLGSDDDTQVLTLSRGRTPLFFMIASCAWLIALFVLANDWRWSGKIITGYWFLSASSGAIFLPCFRMRQHWKSCRLKSFICFRPLYVIRARMDNVEWWLRSSISNFLVTNHTTNGMHERTSLEVRFENTESHINLDKIGSDTLTELERKIDQWNKRFERANRQSDASAYIQFDDFREFWAYPIEQTSKDHHKIKTSGRRLVVEIGIAVLISSIIFISANYANIYIDDQKRWDEALHANSASAYRRYLADHPRGKHVGEAHNNIQQLYAKAKMDYTAGLSQGFEPDAQMAVLQMIDLAMRNNDGDVWVVFEGNNRIPLGVENQIALHYSVNEVIPIGDSFSESKMRQRERRIVDVVNGAFIRLIPQDILQFSTNPGEGNRARLYVGYTIALGKGVYYRDCDEFVQASRRPYYPGISIDWQFEIRDPANNPLYAFSIKSEPAKSIAYRAASFEQSAISQRPAIYDGMAESAFADLQNAMIQKLGVRKNDARQ